MINPSILITPNYYGEGKLLSIIPTDGSGDMNVVRATTATRINSAGLIENVGLNIPRIDYTNGSCPSILVEPQRTNSLTYSEQFDNAIWVKTDINVTSNNTIAPDGNTTADKIIPLSTASKNIFQNSSVTSAQLYTYSVFAKKGEYDFLQIIMDSTGFSGAEDWFNVNLTNGTFGNQIITNIVNKSITSLINGWYKITVTKIATSTTSSGRAIFSPLNSDYNVRLPSYTSDGTSGIYLWGAQLEAGSYATSYIPTVASTVTRNADVISKTGISGLIGQTEGTLYFEGVVVANAEVCNLNRSSANSVFIYIRSTGQVASLVYADSTQLNFISAVQSSSRFKCALAYKSNSIAFYVNGNLVSENTTATFTPNVTIDRFDINLGGYVATQQSQTINKALIFPTRLSNDELATLTTL